MRKILNLTKTKQKNLMYFIIKEKQKKTCDYMIIKKISSDIYKNNIPFFVIQAIYNFMTCDYFIENGIQKNQIFEYEI